MVQDKKIGPERSRALQAIEDTLPEIKPEARRPEEGRCVLNELFRVMVWKNLAWLPRGPVLILPFSMGTPCIARRGKCVNPSRSLNVGEFDSRGPQHVAQRDPLTDQQRESRKPPRPEFDNLALHSYISAA